MGACRPEHADGSMPTGECEQKYEKGVIIGFVVSLWIRYLYEDDIAQTEACKGSMWMGGCGWKRANEIIVTGAIFSDNLV